MIIRPDTTSGHRSAAMAVAMPSFACAPAAVDASVKGAVVCFVEGRLLQVIVEPPV